MAHFRYMASVCIFLLMAVNVTAFQWTSSTPEDGAVIYACAGADVTITWRHILKTGDVLFSIVWDFQGASNEMVAMTAHGTFFATPSYSHRVTFVPNSGIMLSHVSKGDAGNYSVTVGGHDSSGVSIDISRSVMLVVSDDLMTSDHELHVTQQAAPLFSTVTQQFHAVLVCGHFTYTTTHPPVSVVWLTPEGTTVPSTSYNQGDFLLMIPNPVSGGTYSCRIDAATENKSCSHGQTASVTVDATLTRLTLLEAREARKDVIINQLTSEVSQVNSKLDQKEAELNHATASLNSLRNQTENEIFQLTTRLDQKGDLISNLTTRLDQNGDLISNLTTRLDQKGDLISQLTSTVQTLDHELEVVKNRTQHSVAFSARLGGAVQLSGGSPVVLPDVLLNTGHAYDNDTGRFTAPISGTFYFAAFAATSYTSNYASLTLSTTNRSNLFKSVAYEESSYHPQSGSLQGTIHLSRGEQVWLTAGDTSYFRESYHTAFTGFLLSVD